MNRKKRAIYSINKQLKDGSKSLVSPNLINRKKGAVYSINRLKDKSLVLNSAIKHSRIINN